MKISIQNTSTLLLAFLLQSCVLLNKQSSTLKQDSRPLYQCYWGSAEVNLCELPNDKARVDALLAEMTVAEKLGQMTQSVWHNQVNPEVIRSRSIGSIIHTEGPVPGPLVSDWTNKFATFQQAALSSRLGIPLLIGVDAVHGQSTYEGAVIFPHNIGMGATGNVELIKKAAEVTAIETAATGFNWTFSPCIAMPEHEHWGRVYEGFSEDRDLTVAAVKASVRGHQGESLKSPTTIAATAKHFLADGATEGGREGGNSVLTDHEILTRHVPTYQAAVDEGIAAIMVGFNSVNGINMHQHTELVNGLLKQKMGFKGVVMTDWLGGTRFGPPHTVINAGVDMFMQPGNHDEFINKAQTSVLDGTIKRSRLDDAVRRILTLKFNLGLFEQPFADLSLASRVGSKEHRNVARQAVRESLVLLKSDNNVLPLVAGEKIGVVGAHANNSGLQSGGWSIHWQGQTTNYRGSSTILDGIKSMTHQVEYSQLGCHETMAAEKVLVVVGELPYAEFKGDSNNLNLPDYQKAMIASCKQHNKKVILMLISGRPLTMTDSINQSDAFIAAWLPGSEGAAVAEFLYAKDGFKPVGKLPVAWPKRYEDLPLAQDATHALYPFGSGLTNY